MNYYFAPMEGVTTAIYRRAHAEFFPGCDRYYAPFLVACQSQAFRPRELRRLAPEENPGLVLVPQLLGNDVQSFLAAAEVLRGMGFDEVNLNLGCPSGTVTSKRRGSGLLAYPQELDRFLDGIFSGADMKISVKTRIGFSSPEEFPAILEIFNRYPICELIVHPRVRADMYNNAPDPDAFRLAYEGSRAPVCYNGDVFSAADMAALSAAFPELSAVMLGRGCAANPGLIRELALGEETDFQTFRAFHEKLLAAYTAEYSGDKFVLQKMKELWYYMSSMFPGSEKQVKRICKSQRCCDYADAVSALFRDCPFDPAAGFHGQKNSAAF